MEQPEDAALKFLMADTEFGAAARYQEFGTADRLQISLIGMPIIPPAMSAEQRARA